MSFKIHELINFIKNEWNEKNGFIYSLIIFTVFYFSLLIKDFIKYVSDGSIIPSIIICGIYIGIALLIRHLWTKNRALPKVSDNKLGIVLSFICENDEESHVLTNDFIYPLKKTLNETDAGRHFDVIVLPQHLAKEICTKDDALRVRQSMGASFILYGRIRTKSLNGKLLHIIDMGGAVGHVPLNKEAQRKLSVEFGELLSSNIRIPKENDWLEFEFTAEYAAIIAHYIIGIASGLSGYIDYSEKLFASAQSMLIAVDKSTTTYKSVFDILEQRIPLRISELYELRAKYALDSWTETPSDDLLDLMEASLNKVIEKNRSKDQVVYLFPILEYLKHSDTEKAIKLMEDMSSVNKNLAVWHLNYAFLNAAQKDFKKSSRHYNKAAEFDIETKLIYQIEDFINHIIDFKLNASHMIYCVAFFNWKIKGDLRVALSCFKEFLSKCTESEYDIVKPHIHKYIELLEDGIG